MKISDCLSRIMLIAFFGYFSLRLLVAVTFPVRAELQPIPAIALETVSAIKPLKVVKKKKVILVIRKKVPTTTVKEAGRVYYGVVSWYGKPFHGKTMANLKVFNMDNVRNAASRDGKFGELREITNLDNNKKIIVEVTDRGPYPKDKNGNYTRIMDLSYAAACQLDFVDKGLANVKIKVLRTKNLRL